MYLDYLDYPDDIRELPRNGSFRRTGSRDTGVLIRYKILREVDDAFDRAIGHRHDLAVRRTGLGAVRGAVINR